MSSACSGRLVLWVTIILFSGTFGDTRYCKDKFRVIGTHSACLPRSSEAQNTGVDKASRKLIVNEHNRYRGLVSPSAANMLKMSWDDEVALIAQAWAENCHYGHDEGHNRRIPGRFSVGQNIGYGYRDWEAIMKAWYEEYRQFTYGGSNNFHAIGHYSQMVWADTNKIGCGFAQCKVGPYYVCNYGPSGNIGSKINTPYKAGSSCRECQSFCSNRLCDCGEKICENEGTMDRKSCSCSCKHDFNVGRECKLDCENLKQPSYCGSGSFGPTGCKKYSNVPSDCPETCGICPYGGYTYHDNISGAPKSYYTLATILLMILVTRWS